MGVKQQPSRQAYNYSFASYSTGWVLSSTTLVSSGSFVNAPLEDNIAEIEELRDRVKFLEMEVSEEEQKLIEVIRREKITAEELEMLVSLKRIQI